jgi:hypothetical protein
MDFLAARIVDVGNSVIVEASEPPARQLIAVVVLLVDGLVWGCAMLGNGNGTEWECERSVRRVSRLLATRPRSANQMQGKSTSLSYSQNLSDTFRH